MLATIVYLAGREEGGKDGWKSRVWKHGSGLFPFPSPNPKVVITLEGLLNTKINEERSLKIFLLLIKHMISSFELSHIITLTVYFT